jgi:hypothetical protein
MKGIPKFTLPSFNFCNCNSFLVLCMSNNWQWVVLLMITSIWLLLHTGLNFYGCILLTPGVHSCMLGGSCTEETSCMELLECDKSNVTSFLLISTHQKLVSSGLYILIISVHQVPITSLWLYSDCDITFPQPKSDTPVSHTVKVSFQWNWVVGNI